MRVGKRTWKMRLLGFDLFLLACTIGLSCISLLALFGGRAEFGNRALLMQAAMSVLGVLAVVFISSLDYESIVERFSVPLYIFGALLLIITLIFGADIGENRSWIYIPFTSITVQPSEFVKAIYIMTFSRHLSEVEDTINEPRTLLKLALHAGLIIGLVLLSGYLGVALVYIGITAILLFCAGLNLWYFVGALAIVGVAFPFAWEFMAEYQKERILVGFNPDLDPSGKGLQPILSRQAIINGGFFGRGIMKGHYYTTLPIASSDFMYATVCEKMGFVGGFLIIALELAAVVRILLIGRKAKKEYGRLICIGVAGMLILQTLENIGMCLAMVPVIGITLPFVSAGGSSVLATYLIVGIVHAVGSSDKRLTFGRA